MPSPSPSLDDLLQLFTWTAPDAHEACCAALEETYLGALASTAHAELGERARAELAALPPESVRAIVRRADRLFSALYGRSEDLVRSVARWIVVERTVTGAPAALDAPRIANTNITLDFTSELPRGLATRDPARLLVPPSEDQRAVVAEKLGAAWTLLDELAPLASDLVRRVTDVICCRTARGDLRFDTASDPSTLGVIHLTNAHLPRKSPAELAAELLHEAIQQAVFRWELGGPLLDDAELAAAPTVSPWTGAPLELYAYVHACFVWYGVANLWRRPGAPALAAIDRQRAIAEAGFARDPLAALGPLAARLPPAVASAIAAMTRAIAASRAA